MSDKAAKDVQIIIDKYTTGFVIGKTVKETRESVKDRQTRIDNLVECIRKTHTCVLELSVYPTIPMWCGKKECDRSPAWNGYRINID